MSHRTFTPLNSPAYGGKFNAPPPRERVGSEWLLNLTKSPHIGTLNEQFTVFTLLKKEKIMDNKQINRIEELLMVIPTKMCRNMNQRFVNYVLKDISKGLAKHHFMILKMLQENKKLYVTEIVRSLGITKSQMTASVDKLIKLGYIERVANAKDRRKIYISLTKEGSLITEMINTRIKELFHKDIKVLSQNELDELERGLIVLNKFCSLSE